ncbi:MAG: NAD(P)H-dependent glycerol-3-phosphate dehydrogenase [Clostridia bacterium]|nr:NAD(P)H-dependent glycerol-3-phosphate dehydrogenase [Clostridia bacterium]
MDITVIGCGRWGSCIAWYLDKIGHNVTLYGNDLPQIRKIMETRTNGVVDFGTRMNITDDITVAAKNKTTVISIPSQAVRGLLQELQAYGAKDRDYILCMKGIEISTGMRLSQVVREATSPETNIAVWIGPGHVEEFTKGIPNCMVIDSENDEYKNYLISEFSSDLIRFYFGKDLIGNEIGAAAKNVIGIAAGILDGKGLSSLKGALMARGTREVARLIKALGGNELSAYGLCHLGDYEATLFSKFSHNRMYGETFAKGETYGSLAEGYYTVKAILKLASEHNVDMPICSAVYNVLYNGNDIDAEFRELFTRSLKNEF